MRLTDFIVSLPRESLAHGGYWVVFFIAVAEALPFAGTFVPGHTLIILAGFLASLGVLDLGLVIFLAAAGAVVGDMIGYNLGKKYGYGMITKIADMLGISQKKLDELTKAVHAHAGKSLVIGRFSPISRAFTPFLAGAGGIPARKFWLFNILGGLVWSALSVLLGYVFGASYEVAAAYFGKFALVATGLGFLMIIAYRAANARRHVFSKYHASVLALAILATYVFFKLLQDTFVASSFLARADVWMNLKAAEFWTPQLTSFMIAISDVGSPEFLIVLGCILGAIFFAFKKRYEGMFMFLSVTGAAALNILIKELVGRVRPEDALVVEKSFSFPSGHALLSAVFFIALTYVVARTTKNRPWRRFVAGFSVLVIALTGISRVYLGVHWATDVLAGWALAIIWMAGLMLAFRYVATREAK